MACRLISLTPDFIKPNVSSIRPIHDEKIAKNMNAITVRIIIIISLLAQLRNTFKIKGFFNNLFRKFIFFKC